MSFYKVAKCAAAVTAVAGSASLLYYVYKNPDFRNNSVCIESNDLNECNNVNYVNGNSNNEQLSNIISNIIISDVKLAEVEALRCLLEMNLSDKDLEKVLQLIGTLCSYSNNIKVLIKSGIISTILSFIDNIYKRNDYCVKSMINTLKTLSAIEKCYPIFEEYLENIIDCCDNRDIFPLRYGCLALLGNLTLISDDQVKSESKCSQKIISHLNRLILWLCDDRKDGTLRILLHLAHGGFSYRIKILMSNQYKAFSVFIELLQQMNANVYILLRMLYEELSNSSSFENGTLGHYLAEHKELVLKIAETKLQSETINHDVVQRLYDVLSKNNH